MPLPPPRRRHLELARRELPFAAPPTARFVPAKTVGSFVPSLTRKAFEKFGFSTATLLTDWARIVGADLAAFTVPDKLKWPRGPESGGAEDDDGARRAATLMLRVDPARALDVEYRARQIADRINGYFGYRAVETIRLVQAPVERHAGRDTPLHLPSCGGRREEGNPTGQRSGTPPQTPPYTGEGSGDPLSAALARMEKSLLREKAQRRA